jgi:hypothetical protein
LFHLHVSNSYYDLVEYTKGPWLFQGVANRKRSASGDEESGVGYRDMRTRHRSDRMARINLADAANAYDPSLKHHAGFGHAEIQGLHAGPSDGMRWGELTYSWSATHPYDGCAGNASWGVRTRASGRHPPGIPSRPPGGSSCRTSCARARGSHANGQRPPDRFLPD